MITIPGATIQNEIITFFNHKHNRKDEALRTEALDIYINKAVNTFVDNLLSKVGTNDRVHEDLRFLEKKQKLKKNSETKEKNSYFFPEDLIKPSRYDVFASRVCDSLTDECRDCKHRRLVPRPFSQSEVNEALGSAYWRSSFEYEDIVFEKSEQLIHFYHFGDFKVDYIDCYYYRKPKEVFSPELKKGSPYKDALGNIVTQSQPLELGNVFQKLDIIDLVVLFIERDLRMVQDFSTQLQMILSRDKILIN